MKRLYRISILICTIILCACVFPFRLIRKDANVDSRLDMIYEFTEPGKKVVQTFIAQTGYLTELAFDIEFPDGKPETGALVIRIKEVENGDKLIVEKEIPIQEVNESAFTYVTIKKWLKEGALYSYTIIPQEGTAVNFKTAYTTDADAALGNKTFSVDDMLVEGQGVTRYVYGFPLNVKNVICIWAFIWLIGLMLFEMVSKDNLLKKINSR